MTLEGDVCLHEPKDWWSAVLVKYNTDLSQDFKLSLRLDRSLVKSWNFSLYPCSWDACRYWGFSILYNVHVIYHIHFYIPIK